MHGDATDFFLPLIIKFYFSEVAGTCEIVFVVIF